VIKTGKAHSRKDAEQIRKLFGSCLFFSGSWRLTRFGD
jgi:hypothetical protein